MRKPEPIIVSHLFSDTLDVLLTLLTNLSADDWNRPTAAPLWSVKDIAQHLLGGELGILSRKRDGYLFTNAQINSWDDFVAFINGLNHDWVKATQRLSPVVLCDLLEFAGRQVCAYFDSLDPFAPGGPVEWAGPEPAPLWLDLAREYTERWHHQQQIRDAVGKPGLKEPEYFAPVLDAFVRALPQTYRNLSADDDTLIALTLTGDSGGKWFLLRENASWNLYINVARQPQAEVSIDQDVAWRLFTKGLSREEARTRAIISGDQALARRALEMVSVIA
ncbi:MAG: maleylpyruvate isomerase family mycothiol-dependent enzyme [Blastocatellia bacterium]